MGALGYFLGFKLARLYDDSERALARSSAAYASLPTWTHAQLAPEELAAELRDQRIAAFDAKFNALAAIEEAEFKAQRAALH